MKLVAFLLGGLGVAHCAAQCGQGQVPDVNNLCIQPQYIQGCQKYASNTACQECQYRFQLQGDGSCKFSPETVEPCCVEPGQDGKCRTCNVGLYLTKEGTCQESDIPGCLEKDSTGRCENCSSDFYLQDGSCHFGIKDCGKYLNDGSSSRICIDCKEGFSLINNSCLKNRILGCVGIVEEGNPCQKCVEPFRLVGKNCEIADCVTYNDYGCTSCACGFYLTPDNKCEQMIQGCIRYQRGHCTDCQKIYKLKAGQCVIEGCKETGDNGCSKCDDRFEIQKDGGCRLKHCQEWNDGKCSACETNFYVVNGECQQFEYSPSTSLRVESH